MTGGSSQQPQVIKVFCQSCGVEHTFEVAAVGRRARCRDCGYVFRVPPLNAAPAPTVTPPRLPAETQMPQPARDSLSSDSLKELADSEYRPEVTHAAAAEVPADVETPAEDIIREGQVDPQATVTALTIMFGLLIVALITVGVILLENLFGIVFTLWVLLPLVVVYGRKTLTYLAFLLTGRAPA